MRERRNYSQSSADQRIVASGSASVSNVTQVGRDLYIDAGSTSRLSRPNARERIVLINRVRSFWIHGVLDPSVEATGVLDIESELFLEDVHPSLNELSKYQKQQLHSGNASSNRQIQELFDKAGEYLLIAGSAGSGKTTLLLELANELLEQAEHDAALPIPIIFHLSSWRRQTDQLEHWLAKELSTKYDVPPQAASLWVKNNHIAPLLDGLDEVPEDYRQSCVDAINVFRANHGLLPLVVVSRLDEYNVLSNKLTAYGTLILKPLTRNRVYTYIEANRPRTQFLESALHEDPALWDLLDRPLILTIATTVFEGDPNVSLPSENTLAVRRANLFSAYIKKVLNASAIPSRFTAQQTIEGLAWVASMMSDKGLSVFYPQDIQPDWLDGGVLIWFVRSGAALILGIISGVFVAVPLFAYAKHDAAIGLGIFVFVFVSSAAAGAQVANYRKLRWSWRKFYADLLDLTALRTASPPPNPSGYIEWLVINILDMGLVEDQLRETSALRGIQRWIRNSVYVFICSFTAALCVSFILAAYIEVLLLLFSYIDQEFSAGYKFLSALASFTAFMMAILFLPIFWLSLRRGPGDWFRHIAIRVLLAAYRYVPFRTESFLQSAVDRALMYRAAGGYVFIHRMLLEHFASMASKTTES